MFSFFTNKKKDDGAFAFSDAAYKKWVLDNFKVDFIILVSVISLAVATVFLYSFNLTQTSDIKEKTIEFDMAHKKILNFKSVSDKLENIKANNIDTNNIIKIFSFVEQLGVGDYKIEFDTDKRRYYISLQDSDPSLVEKIKELNKTASIVNINDTNASINITRKGAINFKIIFY